MCDNCFWKGTHDVSNQLVVEVQGYHEYAQHPLAARLAQPPAANGGPSPQQ